MSAQVCVQAVLETAVTRVVLPMPILVLPPMLMAMLERLVVLVLLLPLQFRVGIIDAYITLCYTEHC